MLQDIKHDIAGFTIGHTTKSGWDACNNQRLVVPTIGEC